MQSFAGRRVWIQLSVIVLLAASGLSAQPASQPDTSRTILGTGSQWRVFAISEPEALAGELVKDDPRTADLQNVFGVSPRTPPPPAAWASTDFDDSAWTRSAGPFGGLPRGCKTLYLRGRFAVTDPSAAGVMTFAAAYRGGVVVHLNGREVLRKDMPPGPPAPETAAATYPAEAYTDAEGNVVEPYHIAQRVKAGDADLAARVALRDRSAGPVELPAAGLRKGVNVLAVELHRSDYRTEVFKWGNRDLHKWPHVQLQSIRLAGCGDGARPNVDRPAGLQVWQRDIHDIFSTNDYGDPNEPAGPIRLVAARNGYFSAQVVIGSTEPLSGLAAQVGELSQKAGGAKIPADCIRVRYGGLSTLEISARHDGLDYQTYTPVPAFASLLDRPADRIEPTAFKTNPRGRSALFMPAQITPAAVQSVWLTVHVPADAKPGLYGGRLSIRAAGVEPVVMPVELDVIDWTIPPARQFATVMTINQSPETLAMHYGAELWSDAHWRLMERSFELLGHVGNNLLIVPLVCRTQYGNEESYIPWIRQADGSYQFDMTAHDRLVSLARKHFDLRVISYQVYLSNDWVPPGPEKPTFVTVADKATGQRSAMQLPAYGTEDSKKLFRPLIERLRDSHRRLGLDERTVIVLGVAQDGGIHKTVVEQFKEIWPEVRWHYGAHNRPNRKGRADAYGFSEYLYVGPIPSLSTGRRYGWQYQPITVMSQRIYGANQYPMVTRTMSERALVRGDNGAGRMCLDYWPVQEGQAARKQWLYDRWPESRSNQRAPHLRHLALPGADGAVSTAKLEVMREGLQEAEARVFIERALADGKIGGPLADRAQALLDSRVEQLRRVDYIWEYVRAGYGDGWQAGSAELYRLAAQVADALAGR